MPAGAKEVKLPDNPRIKILAITAAYNENDASRAAQKLFDILERNPADYERFAVVPQPVITPPTAHVSPGEPATVSIQVNLDGAEIHYTLDGSDPTEKSPVYSEPLSIKGDAVLKALAFHPRRLPSPVATAFYSQSFPIKDIIYFSPPDPARLGAAEEKTLIDLIKAGPESNDRNWQGFAQENLEVILDLGVKRDVYELTLSCFENNNGRVFLPVMIVAEVSADGKQFETVAEKELSPPAPDKPQGPAVRLLSCGLKVREARYIRVKAVNIGTIPPGFRNAGQKAWMLFDEIYVR